MPIETGDLTLCGWRVRSDLPLPALLPWTGAESHEPDLTISIGTVPAQLPHLVCQTPFLQISADGRVRIEVASIGAFLAEDGRSVTVEPRLAEDAPDIGALLLGAVLGVLCHQRGVLPLHASCLEIGGRAIAFAGKSGAGKSTLAAALLLGGHRLLADDIGVIGYTADGAALIVPAFPQQRLWQDSLHALAITPGRRVRSDDTINKFERGVAGHFAPDPLPLAGVCHLVEARPHRTPGLQRLTGLEAVEGLRRNVYRPAMAAALADGHRKLFQKVSALAASVPQYRLLRPDDLAELPRFAAGLQAALGLEGST